MPAQVSLYRDEGAETPLETLELSELDIGQIGDGEPVQIFAVNTGDTVLQELSIFIEGDGSPYVQLAKNMDEEPGVWAAAGEAIIATESNSVFPNETFSFWVKPSFTFADREATYEFEFVVRGKSISA